MHKVKFEDEIKSIKDAINEVKTVKSVQRGTSSGGYVTISEVDMSKTMVYSVSKGSYGYVAARGSITGDMNLELGVDDDFEYGGHRSTAYGRENYNITGTRTLSGGSTNLTTRQYSARLDSPTQLYCDGAVEWQVVEFRECLCA